MVSFAKGSEEVVNLNQTHLVPKPLLWSRRIEPEKVQVLTSYYCRKKTEGSWDRWVGEPRESQRRRHDQRRRRGNISADRLQKEASLRRLNQVPGRCSRRHIRGNRLFLDARASLP